MTGLFSWVHQEMYQKVFSFLPDPAAMRFVGGVVRNTLLGIPFDDVDFATVYRPEEIIYFFEKGGCKVIPTGIQHGTVTVVCNDQSYEITTLRRDVETDGRHARIEYTSQWEEDARRRDFTMNALYVDAWGRLYDYVGGQDDIQQRLIRFIGDPEQRIGEDYLRIVRFFRFWALYGHKADGASLEACCALKHHLDGLSSERITKEMIKLLAAQDPWAVVHYLHQQGFEPLLWGHSGQITAIRALESIEKSWGPSPLWVRLALLTGQMPQRLTLSNMQKKHLNKLWSPLLPYRTLEGKKGYRELWIATLHSVYDCGLLVTKDRLWMLGIEHIQHCLWEQLLNPHIDHDIKNLDPVDDLFLQGCWNAVVALDHHSFPHFPLSGSDVMAFGLSGPDIGFVLSQTKSWWIDQEMTPTAAQCLDYGRRLISKSQYKQED